MKDTKSTQQEENKKDTRAWFEKNVDEWTEADEQHAFLELFGNSSEN